MAQAKVSGAELSGVMRFVQGSMANTVAHSCHCDVLIVETDTASRHPS